MYTGPRSDGVGISMCEVKRVKSAEIFSVISDILSQGGKAWITVTGMSMYPFLREDKDMVELSSGDFESIKRGDIILIKRRTGAYVLHRVLRKENKCFYMIGDAQKWVEGPLDPDQLIAVVSKIKRGRFEIKCTNIVWTLLTRVWLNVIPFRHWFLKGLRGLFKVYRFVKRSV